MAKVVALQNLPEVRLLEDITRESAARVVEQLAQYKGQEVALSIFSNGGDVKAGNFLAKWIANPANEVKVEARVYGNAASAAMIVAASCVRAYIASGSFAKIHYAYAVDENGDVVEAKDQPQDVRDTLVAINADQVSLFQKRTGQTKAQVEKLMQQDKDVPSEKAVEFGLFDGIIPQEARLAAFASINKPMEEKPKMRKLVIGHKALLAAAFTADGSVEVSETEFTVSDADKVKTLDEQIAALTKERDELKAKADAVPTLETAKAETETKLVAMTKERDGLTTQLEALKKNPLVAQVLGEGKVVVLPGAPAGEPNGARLTAAEQSYKGVQDALAAYDARNKKP